MATSKEFVDFVCEQLAPAGEIRCKKMFGEWGIYCNEKFCACICDGQLLVKITPAAKALWPDTDTALPYPEASPYFLLSDLDDQAFLCRFIETTYNDLPAPKPKKTKKKA